jgi:hypothetical protein
MKVGRVLSIAVVSLATLIVIGAAAIAISVFGFTRSGKQQNVAPSEGQQAISPVGNIVLVCKSSGNSSFLYRKDQTSGSSERLTTAVNGTESEASFSHDGKLVVCSFAYAPDSKSAVWVVGIDGSNPHAITGEEQDALHPVFSPDDSKVFYAASRFTGHYSPVVRPFRHDWDVFSIPVQASGAIAGSAPAQITHESFYDMRSLDATSDDINPGGTRLLISTTGYPIGALIREITWSSSGKNKIFQSHVPGESSAGPSYGEARYVHNGMDVLFLAATDTNGGNYDYNVYSMSGVTGSEIKQLTHLKGMTTGLKVLPGGKATFVNDGVTYLLDTSTQEAKPI